MKLDKYNNLKQIVSVEISEIENEMISAISLEEPLQSSVKQFLQLPSKRIRVLLPLLCLKTFGEDITDLQKKVLSVVEIVHSASLIHDDIIDECTIRRGEETIGSKFGTKLGVIVGDYLLSLALQKLIECKSFYIMDKFSNTIKKMCQGEVSQQVHIGKVLTIEEYIDKTKCKTAYLFETALVSVLSLAKNEYYLDDFSKFAFDVGIAFQIRDDLLNFTSQDLSKPTLNDIQSGVFNAPVILGETFDNYKGGIEKTKILLNNYVENALSFIRNLPMNDYSLAMKELLELLADV